MPVNWPTRLRESEPTLSRVRENALRRAQKQDLACVTSVRVRYDPLPVPHGRYSVRIRGERLRPGPLPLMVKVGGELLIDTRFAKDRRTLTGRLRSRPRGKRMVLDYGFVVVVAKIT